MIVKGWRGALAHEVIFQMLKIVEGREDSVQLFRMAQTYTCPAIRTHLMFPEVLILYLYIYCRLFNFDLDNWSVSQRTACGHLLCLNLIII
jgi:hypothetical protein